MQLHRLPAQEAGPDHRSLCHVVAVIFFYKVTMLQTKNHLQLVLLIALSNKCCLDMVESVIMIYKALCSPDSLGSVITSPPFP